jgi:preprotein translocase subunit SecA
VKKESDNYFKTENQYMADNNREMHKIDEALYFVIEEKNNQVELTDHGIKFLSGDTDSDFYSSRYWN